MGMKLGAESVTLLLDSYVLFEQLLHITARVKTFLTVRQTGLTTFIEMYEMLTPLQLTVLTAEVTVN